VAASPVGAGRHELLAVVEIATAEQGDLRLGPGGPQVTLLDLPYPFPEPETREH
jgi:hypothetical protein